MKIKLLIIALAVIAACCAGHQNATQVSTAPEQFFLKNGQSENFYYWNHEIAVSYTKNEGVNLIKLVVDGKTTLIRKNESDSGGIYLTIHNLHFSIKPVLWSERGDGKKVPIFEKTWNVSEIYVEVLARGGGS